MGQYVKLLIAYILLVVLGIFGAHKFYLRKYKTGILYLFLFLFSIIIESVFNKPDFSGLILLVLLILIVIDFITLPFQLKKMSARNEIKASDLTNRQKNKEQDRIIKEVRKNAKTESKLKRKQEFQDRLKAKLAEKEEKRKAKEKEKIDKVYKEAKNYYDNVRPKFRKKFKENLEELWFGEPIIISFQYPDFDTGKINHRVLGLYQILENSFGDLYFIGYCYKRKQERTFKVERIESGIIDDSIEIEIHNWISKRFIFDEYNNRYIFRKEYPYSDKNQEALEFYKVLNKNNLDLYNDNLTNLWAGIPITIQFQYSLYNAPTSIKMAVYRIAKNRKKNLILYGYNYEICREYKYNSKDILSKIVSDGEEFTLDEWLEKHTSQELNSQNINDN